ncbi:DUF58 domain-containing protein [Bacillus benzoevorans]|uniref:Uncharacterized protein (DUF58 family) n=1 Tax=Bacillus benzoevorans TaxID=1456 RepID=A0A7X0HN20_9BACI|nr:DUF58 domain-containing protein [Bacillus benzoevorans]MBB6443812.1 uncharacterized protein (DUF58 family) [Bacillus benzoevorans]
MNGSQHFLGKLQRRKLLVKDKRRGIQKGQRKANTFGSSLEFSDFRLYQPGDDVRQIDWNIYGRTQKHYIKRFLDEQDISVSIYLDCTSSMRILPGKWSAAKRLAAYFSFIILNSGDKLLFFPVSSNTMLPIRRKGALYAKSIFQDIMTLEDVSRTGEFSEHLASLLVKNSQLAIIISDGMEPFEKMEGLFKKLQSLKQEIWFFQVLSAEELEPDYSQDMRLIDSETEEYVNVSMNQAIKTEYESRLKKQNGQLETLCRCYGGQYLLLSEKQDLQTYFLHDLPAKGLVR